MSIYRMFHDFRDVKSLILRFLILVIALCVSVEGKSATLSPEDLKNYQHAFKAIDQGRWKVALGHAKRPQNRLPAKAVQWLYLLSDSSNAPFSEIKAFIDQNPAWPKQGLLKKRAEQAMTDALPDREILSWFQNNPPQTGAGFHIYAAALNRNGLSEMLSAEAIRAWRELDMTRDEERSFRRKYRLLVPMKDEIFRLHRLIWDGRYTAASRQAKRVPENQKRIAEARIRLARRRGGVDAAIRHVPKMFQKDPGLVYERVRWRRRKGKITGAVDLLKWPDMQISHPDKWWTERAFLARKLLETGKAKAAYEIASQHRVPDGAGFAEAEWFSGWVALRFLKAPERALTHFEDMYENVGYPVSRSRASYWAGRAAESAGRPEISQHWYHLASHHRSSFYGQLAAMKLPAHMKSTARLGTPNISAEEKLQFEAQEIVQLAPLLARIGAQDTLKSLVRHMADTYQGAAFLSQTAKLATDVQRLDLAVYTSRQAIKQNQIELAGYPVLAFNSHKTLESALIYGVIRQESGFDIKAKSRAGARGLMQLMPATAKVVSRWEGLKYKRSALTTDANYNIQLGSAYLENLFEQFDGVLPMAFAGYNAGPHRVFDWVRRFGDPRKMVLEEKIDWIELIPFRETRNYVQRVLENVNVYQQRESEGPVPIKMIYGENS